MSWEVFLTFCFVRKLVLPTWEVYYSPMVLMKGILLVWWKFHPLKPVNELLISVILCFVHIVMLLKTNSIEDLVSKYSYKSGVDLGWANWVWKNTQKYMADSDVKTKKWIVRKNIIALETRLVAAFMPTARALKLNIALWTSKQQFFFLPRFLRVLSISSVLGSLCFTE